MRVTEAGMRIGSFGTQVYSREERLITSQGSLASVNTWLPPTFWAAQGSRFYFADASNFEIRVYSGTGALGRIVRARYQQLSPPTTTPPPASFHIPSGSDPHEAAAAAQRATMPERLHAYAGFHVDRTGNMWVMEYEPHWIKRSRSSHRWWVFDSTGVLRQSVLVPGIHERTPWPGGSYRGLEIGEDYILGLRSNADGAEEIVMYDLRKSPRR